MTNFWWPPSVRGIGGTWSSTAVETARQREDSKWCWLRSSQSLVIPMYNLWLDNTRRCKTSRTTLVFPAHSQQRQQGMWERWWHSDTGQPLPAGWSEMTAGQLTVDPVWSYLCVGTWCTRCWCWGSPPRWLATPRILLQLWNRCRKDDFHFLLHLLHRCLETRQK